MDRCSICGGQLYFYGISIKPFWSRWMQCNSCAKFSAGDMFGTLQAIVKVIPKEVYFPVSADKERRS